MLMVQVTVSIEYIERDHRSHLQVFKSSFSVSVKSSFIFKVIILQISIDHSVKLIGIINVDNNVIRIVTESKIRISNQTGLIYCKFALINFL